MISAKSKLLKQKLSILTQAIQLSVLAIMETIHYNIIVHHISLKVYGFYNSENNYFYAIIINMPVIRVD